MYSYELLRTPAPGVWFKLYPVNRTVGVLKNPTDRQAITLKFGQRIQAGIH